MKARKSLQKQIYLQTSLYTAGGNTGSGRNIHSCRFLSICVWFQGYSATWHISTC